MTRLTTDDSPGIETRRETDTIPVVQGRHRLQCRRRRTELLRKRFRISCVTQQLSEPQTALTPRLDSLLTDSALQLEYIPPGNIFAKHQSAFDSSAKITNRDIEECPVWDGGSLWVIMGVSIQGVIRNTAKVAEMDGDSLRNIDSIAIR